MTDFVLIGPAFAAIGEAVGFNESGSKYLRAVPCATLGRVDVYEIRGVVNTQLIANAAEAAGLTGEAA